MEEGDNGMLKVPHFKTAVLVDYWIAVIARVSSAKYLRWYSGIPIWVSQSHRFCLNLYLHCDLVQDSW